MAASGRQPRTRPAPPARRPPGVATPARSSGRRPSGKRAERAQQRPNRGLSILGKLAFMLTVPLLGGAFVLSLVWSGAARFNEDRFVNNLPRVLIGALALGIAVPLFLLPLSARGKKLARITRVVALVTAVLALLVGFYFASPPAWTEWLKPSFIAAQNAIRGIFGLPPLS